MERLHFGEKTEHKSSVGGFCTMCIFVGLIWLTYWKATQLFEFDAVHEVKGPALNEHEKILMTKSVFFLSDVAQEFDFDPSKIDVYIERKHIDYGEDGSHHYNYTTRYDLKKCTESDFNSTPEEQDYWEDHKNRKPYCI